MAAEPNRVREVFLAAAEMPAAERSAYLAEVCGADADLRAAVERLLAPDAEASSIEGQPPLESSGSPGRESQGAFALQPDVGTVLVGRYQLLEKIGEGGMGAVWSARQTEPIKRIVAVKLIKPGMDSKAVLARFEAERQALALMDHPNIARVFDAGATADGLPFFVMERVLGVPINEFCDARKLTPRERLELFVPICHAIQHAHQKGIIHRDIKPSNVLVALYDDRAVPKVIDFGVAKATGPTLTEKTLHTGFGTVVGTPQYMSPEQATFNNLDIDTRSDVYSLGALLYTLLTGSPPFTRKELQQAGMLEMLRVIREQEPPRPSTKLSSAKALPSLAAKRSTEPLKLTALLRDELDWIVMKAIEKDRTRRYETANGFAADVQRYLTGEPVQAVPPSTAYRVRKFVRRHRGGLLAASVLVLALLGAVIGIAYGVIEAGNQQVANSLREAAEKARDGEERQRKAAETARDGEARERKVAVAARAAEEKARKAAETALDQLAKLRSRTDWSDYGTTIKSAYEQWRSNNVPAARALLDATRKDLRGWEWNYVNRLCNAQLLTLKGHTGFVLSGAYSPDGKRAVTASQDQTARVWDTETGALVAVLKGHTGWVHSAVFSGDGKRVATASYDGTARVWDAASGKAIGLLQHRHRWVTSAVFSGDGKRVLTASADGMARVWDVASKAAVAEFRDNSWNILGTAEFSPDGKWVVTTAGGHAEARVWDAASGTAIATLKGHGRWVKSAVFSGDSKRVITAAQDGTARVWDAASGTQLAVFKGHFPASVTSAVFSPDGKRALTAGRDGTARVWDAASGTEIAVCKGHTGPVTSAVFSADGKRVLTASTSVPSQLGNTMWKVGDDTTARVWDAASGAELAVLKGHLSGVNSAAFSPDGFRVLTTSLDGTARVWDAQNPPEPPTLIFVSSVISAAYSGDGKRIVAYGPDVNPGDVRIGVWDLTTGNRINGYVVDSGDAKQAQTASGEGRTWVYSASHSRDGKRKLRVNSPFAGESNQADLCDAQPGGRTVLAFKGHQGGVLSAVFSPDRKWVVTASQDGTARVWDAASAATLVILKGHTDVVNSAVFSGDRQRVLTASNDRTARVWNAVTGAELLALKGHDGSVNSAVFSPDDKRVLTGSTDKTARVWDATYGAELAILKGHDGYVTAALFSPDGRQVLTACTDRKLRLWDAQGQPTFVIRYREAVRLDPSNPVMHYELGRALSRMEDLAGAVESFKDALRLDPKFDKCHAELRDIVYNVGLANPLLDQLAAEYPGVLAYRTIAVSRHMILAKRAVEAGNQPEATAEYRKGLAIRARLAADFPAEPDHLAKLAQGHRELGDMLSQLRNEIEAIAEFRKARQVLEDLVAKYPAEGKYGADLATIRFMMGDPTGAWSEQTPATRVIFAPDGRYFVAADGRAVGLPIRIYNARGVLLTELRHGRTQDLSTVGLSPDGSKLVGFNHVWEVPTGKLLFKLDGQADHAEFSPDGRRIVSGGARAPTQIWDASSGKLLHSLEGTGVSYCSPNNRWIVSFGVGKDKAMRCWDAASAVSGIELWKQSGQSLPAPTSLDVYGSIFSPDGSRVLSVTDDNSVCVWETASGKSIARLASPIRVVGAVFVSGGSRLVAWGYDKKLRVWDLPSGKLASEVDLGSDLPFSPGLPVSVSPDGRLLLTAHRSLKPGSKPGSDQVQVRLRDLATGKTVHGYDIVEKRPFFVRSLTFSPDLHQVAAAGGGGVYVWKMPELESPGKPFVPEIVAWRTEPGPAEIRKFVGHTNFVYNLAITPDGKTALSVSQDRTAIIWDVDTGKLRHRLSGSPDASDALRAPALTPDGKLALTGGDFVSKDRQRDTKIRVWDTQSGKLVHALAGHTSPVSMIMAAKQGLIVSSSWDHTILRWDPLDVGKPKRLFKLEAPPCALAIDANGERIAVGSPAGSVAILREGDKAPITWYPSLTGAVDNLVWVSDSLLGVAGVSKVPALLDIKTKTSVKLVGHTKDALGIDAVPGGKYVVTGSDDGTVRVWRVSDGSAVSRFNAGCGMIRAVRVLPDGLHVLCTGGDGTLRLWRLTVPKAGP